MNRRGFLQTCLALAAAPAIVRADSLMRVVPRDLSLLLPAEPIAPLLVHEVLVIYDEPAWVCFVDPNLESHLRGRLDFRSAELYAARSALYEGEIGTLDGGIRIVRSSPPVSSARRRY